MITLSEIKKFYPSEIHRFDRGLLREYLQYLILSIIFSHKLGNKLSFLGGTCLRLVYGSKRFSEDIDFDNKNLSEEEFKILSDYIKSELEKFGLQIEIQIINKLAFHCKIKFHDLLQTNAITNIKSEKILIQVDTFDQKVNYQTESHILNKFDITKPIITTPKSVILSQKLWTITNREKAKGRDFYDIVFLLQNTKPDHDFLFNKFNLNNITSVKTTILEYIKSLNFEELGNDVRPFLINENDINKIKYFNQLFTQVELE